MIQNRNTAPTSTHHLPTHYDDDEGIDKFERQASDSERATEVMKKVPDGYPS